MPRPPSCRKGAPVSSCLRSIRAGATAAAGAAARRRCARRLARAHYREGGEHHLRIGALTAGADLALVAARITAEDVKRLAATQAGELVDRHVNIVRLCAQKFSSTRSFFSSGTEASI